MIVYKNKYGFVEIEVVGEYQNVSKIDSKSLDDEVFFSVDVAEKLALITGNVRLQIGCSTARGYKCYLVHHQTGSVGAICKIVSLKFTKKVNATTEIELQNNLNPLILSHMQGEGIY